MSLDSGVWSGEWSRRFLLEHKSRHLISVYVYWSKYKVAKMVQKQDISARYEIKANEP